MKPGWYWIRWWYADKSKMTEWTFGKLQDNGAWVRSSENSWLDRYGPAEIGSYIPHPEEEV